MAAKLALWKALANTWRVETGVASCPVFYLSETSPSLSDLQAVSDAELAAGWPQAIVDRAAARRVSKTNFWFGPRGFTMGRTPIGDICAPGSNIEWCRKIATPRDVTEAPGMRFWPMQIWPNPQGVGVHDNEALLSDLTAATKFVRWMMDMPELEVVSLTHEVMWAGIYAVDYRYVGSIADAMAARATDEHMIVAYMIHSSEEVCFVRVVRPPGMKGVTGLYFSYNCGSINSEQSVLGTHWMLRVMAMEPGWVEIMKLFDGNIQTDSSSIGLYQDGRKVIYCPGSLRAPVTPMTGVSPFGTDLASGPLAIGLERRSVYHIGDPEFVDSFTMRGDVTKTQETRTLSVASGVAFVEWPGSRIVDLHPSMVQADKDQLIGKRFVTCIDHNALNDTLKLEDLSIWQDCVDGGVDLPNEEFMPAKDGNPAIKFSEALERANAGDKTLFHQTIGHAVRPQDVVRVVISGNAPNYVVTSYSDAWTVAPGSVDDAAAAIAAGARLYNASNNGDTAAVVTAVFGRPIGDIMIGGEVDEKQNDFNEETVFGGNLPDVRTLTTAKRTAVQLVQHCISRKHLSSFVIGAMTMAAVARRKLL